MNRAYEELYGVRLLDDIHNFFPAILYEPTRFQTVPQLLLYISTRTSEHFNLFNRGQNQFIASRNMSNPVSSLSPLRHVSINTPSMVNRTPGINLGVDIITETIDITPFLSSILTDSASVIRNLISPASLSDPVIVAPTEQQIASATCIQEANEEAYRDLICSICQEGYTNGQLVRKLNYCNHRFHKTCIDPWFVSHVHCPVCRHDIRETITQPTPTIQPSS